LTSANRNPFRVASDYWARLFSQGFKANPGLKLANAFSVKTSAFSVKTALTH